MSGPRRRDWDRAATRVRRQAPVVDRAIGIPVRRLSRLPTPEARRGVGRRRARHEAAAEAVAPRDEFDACHGDGRGVIAADVACWRRIRTSFRRLCCVRSRIARIETAARRLDRWDSCFAPAARRNGSAAASSAATAGTAVPECSSRSAFSAGQPTEQRRSASGGHGVQVVAADTPLDRAIDWRQTSRWWRPAPSRPRVGRSGFRPRPAPIRGAESPRWASRRGLRDRTVDSRSDTAAVRRGRRRCAVSGYRSCSRATSVAVRPGPGLGRSVGNA